MGAWVQRAHGTSAGELGRRSIWHMGKSARTANPIDRHPQAVIFDATSDLIGSFPCQGRARDRRDQADLRLLQGSLPRSGEDLHRLEVPQRSPTCSWSEDARLVAAAAARFKERGVDGISLADLMKDPKLTHGGFYRHFDSREELVAETLDLALAQSGQSMREHFFDRDQPDFPGFVDFYLDEAHRDGRATGCAVAALAGDAPRKSADVQAQFRRQIETNLATLSEALRRGGSAAEARATALLVLSALYGALMMARAVGDSPLSREVLHTVRQQVLKLGSPARKARPRPNARKKTSRIDE